MKRICILVLVLAICSSLALAETCAAEIQPIQYQPEEYAYAEYPFWPLSVEKWSDEAILIAGKNTMETEKFSVAGMMLMGLDGKILWQHEESDLPETTQYNSAYRLDDQTIIALQDENGVDYLGNCYIEWINTDGLQQRSAPRPKSEMWLTGIIPNDRGMLLVSHPHSNSDKGIAAQARTVLEQLDRDGQTIWTANYAEYLILQGSLQNGENSILYGTESSGTSGAQSYQGIIMEIDSQGALVRKQYSPEFERYTGGCLLADGSLLLIGNYAEPSKYSGVCRTNWNEFAWHTQLPAYAVDSGDADMKSDLATSIIPVQGDYLIASMGLNYRGASAWLYRINDAGEILRVDYVFNEQIDNFEGCKLLELNGNAYLLGYGMVDADDLTVSWNEGKTMRDYARGFYLAKLDF